MPYRGTQDLAHANLSAGQGTLPGGDISAVIDTKNDKLLTVAGTNVSSGFELGLYKLALW